MNLPRALSRIARPSRRSLGLAAGVLVIVALGGLPFAQEAVSTLRGPTVAGPGTTAVRAGITDVAAGAQTEGSPTQRRIDSLISRLKSGGDDAAGYRDLGLALLQRVRETGDPTLYTRAEESFERALKLEPRDPGILVGIGVLQLARHEFADALETGRAALALAPVAAARGVVVDALTELGRYDEAVTELQLMVDARPNLASFSRISYARELRGDLEGALEAVALAEEAGGQVAENAAFVAWLRGNLLTYLGRTDEARAAYDRALGLFPNYAPALAGIGRLAVAAGDLPAAIAAFDKAASILPLPEYVVALGEAYEASGRIEQARQAYDLVRVEIQLLQANGVIADVEIALFEADHGDLKLALSVAREAYAARQNVRTADALAWATYRNGDVAKALELSREATRLGYRDAALLYHAGTIKAAAGLKEEAIADLKAGLATDAGFSATGAKAARELLRTLE